MARKKAKKKSQKNNIWKRIISVIVVVVLIFQVFQTVADNNEIRSANYDNLEYIIVADSIPNAKHEYMGFTVYFNNKTHIPNCTVYELTAQEAKGSMPREDNFHHDENIKGCPTLDDYKYSGFDRGHMVPAGDMKWNATAMSDCFSLANMVPQKGALNSGAWNQLEQKVRNWVIRDSALIVITGPIVTKKDYSNTIGETGVVVPGSLFKIVLAHKVSPMRAIAIVYPNKKAEGSLAKHITTVDAIEKAIGIDFFSALPDEIEDKIEATSDLNQWNQHKN